MSERKGLEIQRLYHLTREIEEAKIEIKRIEKKYQLLQKKLADLHYKKDQLATILMERSIMNE